MLQQPTEETWLPGPKGRIFARRWLGRDSAAQDLPPIILLHDSLGCVALWRDFPAMLSEATGHDVIAYDRWGFGRSDARPGPMPQTFVEDEMHCSLALVRDKLKVHEFVLLGHSIGGGMGLATAGALHGACKGLVSISAQTFVEDRTVEGIRQAQVYFEQPEQIQRLSRYHGDKAVWVLKAWTDMWLDPTFKNWSIDSRITQITCPVLAIHGENDEYGSKRHAERIAVLRPDRTALRILQGAGHFPHRENPHQIVDWVRVFLNSI